MKTTILAVLAMFTMFANIGMCFRADIDAAKAMDHKVAEQWLAIYEDSVDYDEIVITNDTNDKRIAFDLYEDGGRVATISIPRETAVRDIYMTN